MFERFTDGAQAVVRGSQVEAHDRGASSVRSEHLLAAVLTVPDTLAQATLTGLEVDLPALLRAVRALPDDADPPARPTAADAQALAALGIDLAEVRRRIEESFGPGALERTRAAQGRRAGRRRPRWDSSAKKVLELSLREALHLRHHGIGTEHVLLGLLHPGTGAAQQVLAGAGVRLDTARLLVAELVRGRAAG